MDHTFLLAALHGLALTGLVYIKNGSRSSRLMALFLLLFSLTLINDRLDLNFFEFVNRYRVEEAGRLLADPDNSDLTILHIAYESGFNNKTSFNKAFKEASGMTPSQFKKSGQPL